jgi:hypothetical protein
MAAGLCVLNMLFAARYLTEVRKPAALGADGSMPVRKGSREAIVRVLTHPADPSSRLILIYAIAIGAFQGITAILALFLAWKFDVTKDSIGYFYTYLGTLSVVIRALFLGRVVDHFGEPRLSRWGLLFLAGGLVRWSDPGGLSGDSRYRFRDVRCRAHLPRRRLDRLHHHHRRLGQGQERQRRVHGELGRRISARCA